MGENRQGGSDRTDMDQGSHKQQDQQRQGQVDRQQNQQGGQKNRDDQQDRGTQDPRPSGGQSGSDRGQR